MASWRDELEFEFVFVFDVVFHVVGNFVVEDVFFGLDACALKSFDEDVIGSYHFAVLPAFHWFDEDCVAVDFHQHHDVFVSSL